MIGNSQFKWSSLQETLPIRTLWWRRLSLPSLAGQRHYSMQPWYPPLLFPYAAQRPTKLDGLAVVTINGITATRYRHQMSFEPGWVKYLHVWGEAGTVSLKGKKHLNIKNKGTTMMFVWYPDNHSAHTFNMWDSNTQQIHKTRDVIFLNCIYFSTSSNIQAGEGANSSFGISFAPLASSDDEDDVPAVDR